MLAHPTLDQLHTLGLHGLAKGFKELEHRPETRSLDHAEWLGLLLDYELTLRRQKQFGLFGLLSGRILVDSQFGQAASEDFETQVVFVA